MISQNRTRVSEDLKELAELFGYDNTHGSDTQVSARVDNRTIARLLQLKIKGQLRYAKTCVFNYSVFIGDKTRTLKTKAQLALSHNIKNLIQRLQKNHLPGFVIKYMKLSGGTQDEDGHIDNHGN